MPSPPTIDLASLLMPVAEGQPAGPELRQSPDRSLAALFLVVRDARRKAIDAERRLRDFASMTDEEKKSQPGAPDPADWDSVRRHALEALTRSKDLWVTAWLIEALTRLHGFAGLRDGVRLTRQLCEMFWTELHPQPDAERDLATRFAQLAGLDGGSTSEGTLIGPISNLPLTQARTVADFSLAEYKDAIELERKSPDIRRRRVEQGALTVEMFDQAVAETSAGFFLTLRADIDDAMRALVELHASLKQKEEAILAAGGHAFAPSFSNLRELLDECARLSKASMKNETAPGDRPDSEPGPTPGGPPPDPYAGANSAPLTGAGIESREQAIAMLMRVSDFFRRTEPHSPISYGIEQVVRWGRMSLPELLSELVSDRSAREEIFRRAGIPQDRTD